MPETTQHATRLDEDLIELLVSEHTATRRPELERLWAYYANPVRTDTSGRRRAAQEAGLPSRLTGVSSLSMDDRKRREVVIENDIAWRIQTMIDFLFGRPVRIVSAARDEQLAERIERELDAVWEASGGIALLQDMALLGHVYGHVDLVLRGRAGGGGAGRGLRIEAIDPLRGIPVLNPWDYRELDGYVIHAERELNQIERGASGLLAAIRRGGVQRKRVGVTEVLTPTSRTVREDGRVIEDGPNRAASGVLPVVHVQNMSSPFAYSGVSEVAALTSLQDELNTRLSDRACRVTMQSFKMYLAKGLDGFDAIPVGPGQIWSTDNPDASVEAFGGDASSPSEDAHIGEIREALDKVSAVPPLAGGVIRAKIGNLSSANALRITLMSLISKTQRKRVTYGRGIARMSGLVLAALDSAGVLKTSAADRGVRLEWANIVPEEPINEVRAAAVKAELGVPRERVLAELGYGGEDDGVV